MKKKIINSKALTTIPLTYGFSKGGCHK